LFNQLCLFLRTGPSRDEWKTENWYYAQLNKEIHIQERGKKCLHIELFRGFQSALKAVLNTGSAPNSIVSIRGEIRSLNEGSDGAQWRSASHFAVFIFV